MPHNPKNPKPKSDYTMALKNPTSSIYGESYPSLFVCIKYSEYKDRYFFRINLLNEDLCSIGHHYDVHTIVAQNKESLIYALSQEPKWKEIVSKTINNDVYKYKNARLIYDLFAEVAVDVVLDYEQYQTKKHTKHYMQNWDLVDC